MGLRAVSCSLLFAFRMCLSYGVKKHCDLQFFLFFLFLKKNMSSHIGKKARNKNYKAPCRLGFTPYSRKSTERKLCFENASKLTYALVQFSAFFESPRGSSAFHFILVFLPLHLFFYSKLIYKSMVLNHVFSFFLIYLYI